MDDREFFAELQELLFQVEDLVDKHNVRNRYISVILCGLMDPNLLSSSYSNIRALYNYNITNREELEEVQDFIKVTYIDDDWDIEGFLNELGIELE